MWQFTRGFPLFLSPWFHSSTLRGSSTPWVAHRSRCRIPRAWNRSCSCRSYHLNNGDINGLVFWKIYRKPWFLPSNRGVSCKLSHHQILWNLSIQEIIHIKPTSHWSQPHRSLKYQLEAHKVRGQRLRRLHQNCLHAEENFKVRKKHQRAIPSGKHTKSYWTWP